jgi:D-proline reductase (dithiol) PrdB
VQPYLDQFRPNRVSGRPERRLSSDRLNELAASGAIGSVADEHYSFMGATDPMQMEPYARELSGRLKQDAVNAVVLPPV